MESPDVFNFTSFFIQVIIAGVAIGISIYFYKSARKQQEISQKQNQAALKEIVDHVNSEQKEKKIAEDLFREKEQKCINLYLKGYKEHRWRYRTVPVLMRESKMDRTEFNEFLRRHQEDIEYGGHHENDDEQYKIINVKDFLEKYDNQI